MEDDSGTVTAEFAITLPAVLVVIALVVSSLFAAGRAISLEHAAAQSARSIARGDDAASIAAATRVGAGRSVSASADLVCVTLTAPAGVPLPLPDLSATSCALAGGK